MSDYYKEIPGWFSDDDVGRYRQLASSIKDGIIVEVGSFVGRSAVSIGEVCRANNNKLYCVDHWAGSPEYFPSHEYFNILKPELLRAGWPHIYDVFLLHVKKAGLLDVIIPVRMASADAAKGFKEVDMVFIDANHTFEAVTEDLTAWWPHVKPGGVMIGHDYGPTWPGVVQAVDTYFDNKAEPFEGMWLKRKEQ